MDFKLSIAARIAEALGVDSPAVNEIAEAMQVPPDPNLGDFAYPCFKLAKRLRKAPPAIADALSASVSAPFLKEVKSVAGYLNFFVDRATYAREVLTRAQSQGARYGGGAEGEGKTVCIDYSSINIMKRFHIGHLSTTMIGNALYRMYAFRGYRCVGINHLGDWGTQFGKMIVAFTRWGSREDVEREGVDALVRLYVRYHEEAEKDPALDDEARAWFKRIEDGDAQALQYFEWFKEITLRYAQGVYELLDVKFDSYAGESFYNDKMGRVIDELKEKNLLVESQGAYVVDLSDAGMPPCIILKRDGATLYATRDLAAALYRMDTYHFDRCLYVVAYQQDLHFRQWFEVLRRMGYAWADRLEHVSYGMVSFEGKALSTRHGNIVYLDELLAKAVDKALSIIEEKSPELADKPAVARQVGVGAVVFFDLYNNRIKDIDFYWDRALNFDGETGPYVQYCHARCCSVLRKADVSDAQPDFSALAGPEAQEVVRLIDQFPDAVTSALERSEPSLVARYSVDLAQAFNKFYYECRILDDEPAARAAKLLLTDSTRQTIATALNLIGIQAPERM